MTPALTPPAPGGPFFMPCLHSKPAWQAKLPNEKGRRPLRFNPPTTNTPPDLYIGCGKCEGCAAQRALEWAIRMAHESQCHQRNCFLTLTYAEAPEKINRYDPQTFIKRLRHHSSKPIRYFLTGEYGEKTHRPHYHAIIFGEDFLGGAYDINGQLYGNKALDAIWKHGSVAISEFTLATAMYVSGYVNKKIGDNDTFSIMSRYPPIGKPWVRKHADNLRRIEKCVINGQEMPIPGVYLKWLEGVEEYDHIKQNRKDKAVTLTDQQLKAKGLNLKSFKNLRSHTI